MAYVAQSVQLIRVVSPLFIGGMHVLHGGLHGTHEGPQVGRKRDRLSV